MFKTKPVILPEKWFSIQVNVKARKIKDERCQLSFHAPCER
jgi:hypothetical protein